MRSCPITPLLLGLLMLPGLPGCPSPSPSPSSDRHVVYLAPDMVETRVKLVDQEPDPF